MRRLHRIAAAVVVLCLLVVLPAQGEDRNLIKNGSFEEGSAGGVGAGWAAFNNGGHSQYAFAIDSWKPVLWDGKCSQLIVIKGGGLETDRYAGIQQTVEVVPGTTYRLTIHGVVRSSEGSPTASGYGYRVQWAIDHTGGADWQRLDPAAWQELNWYEWPLQSPGYIDTFSTDVKATSNKLTLFVRAWKKWKTVDSEGDFNLDAISLVGPAPSGQSQQGSQLPASGAGLILPGAGALLGVALAARGGRALLARRRARALDRSARRRV